MIHDGLALGYLVGDRGARQTENRFPLCHDIHTR
jgi:hypothetical protein